MHNKISRERIYDARAFSHAPDYAVLIKMSRARREWKQGTFFELRLWLVGICVYAHDARSINKARFWGSFSSMFLFKYKLQLRLGDFVSKAVMFIRAVTDVLYLAFGEMSQLSVSCFL